jgi:hypothetical protein
MAHLSVSHNTVQGGFWADIDDDEPQIHRLRDRVFVGNAAVIHNNRFGATDSWVPDGTAGANWIPRDSQLTVLHDRGGLAISGFSRTSDGDDIASGPATIGITGATIGDSTGVRSCWAGYFDVQFESGTYGYGMEIAVKNKSDDRSSTPYFMTVGTYGIWMPAGGDDSYGGAHTNPNNTAIAIGKNSSTWNRGIVFQADGLTGVDINGLSGTALAILLGTRHLIRWYTPSNATGAQIYSAVTTTGGDQTIVFANSQTRIQGSNSADIARFEHLTSGVNYFHFKNAAASSEPEMSVVGTDTDIDITLTPKGAGNVRFGTHTGNADAAISGYVTIKDSAGNARKLAVIT